MGKLRKYITNCPVLQEMIREVILGWIKIIWDGNLDLYKCSNNSIKKLSFSD